LKPIKTGLVGRKGSASKQAFIVGFFTQDAPELLKLNVKKRYRRNAVTDLRNEFEPESKSSIKPALPGNVIHNLNSDVSFRCSS